jgi:hypothetical protein
LFENRAVRESFIASLFESRVEPWEPDAASTETPYDRAAALVAEMDVDTLLDAVGVDVDVDVAPP